MTRSAHPVPLTPPTLHPAAQDAQADRADPGRTHAVGSGALKACLATLAIAMTVAACGGGGGDDNGGTPPPAPPAGPTPPAGPPPVTIAESCAAPATGGTAPNTGENPTQIGATIDAYTNCNSVFAGQKITFHVSDNSGQTGVLRNANMRVWRVGETDQQVLDRTISISKQFIPKNAWENCCNWPVSYTLDVPESWSTGYYKARFTSPDGGVSWLSFVVKNRTPGSVSKLVFQPPFDTSQMYNPWGGKSAYTYNSSNGIKAEVVSMRRPSEIRYGNGNDLMLGVVEFIRWAESRNIALEYLAGDDLHASSGVLSPYKAFVTVGHDEYWSQSMRDELDRFIDAGGNAAIMSGNTMWWRTHKVTDQYGQALGLLKGKRTSGTDEANWFEFDNETRTIGASYFKGGYVNHQTQPTLINEDYTIYQPSHWAFEGTGATQGAKFGGDDQIHRYESDGLDVRFVNGKPVPTGTDGAPAGTQILAYTALPAGWDSPSTNAGFTGQGPNLTGTEGPNAVISTFTRPNGGTVFNFGSTDYFRPLVGCTGTGAPQKMACRIAENVLTRLGGN